MEPDSQCAAGPGMPFCPQYFHDVEFHKNYGTIPHELRCDDPEHLVLAVVKPPEGSRRFTGKVQPRHHHNGMVCRGANCEDPRQYPWTYNDEKKERRAGGQLTDRRRENRRQQKHTKARTDDGTPCVLMPHGHWRHDVRKNDRRHGTKESVDRDLRFFSGVDPAKKCETCGGPLTLAFVNTGPDSSKHRQELRCVNCDPILRKAQGNKDLFLESVVWGASCYYQSEALREEGREDEADMLVNLAELLNSLRAALTIAYAESQARLLLARDLERKLEQAKQGEGQ